MSEDPDSKAVRYGAALREALDPVHKGCGIPYRRLAERINLSPSMVTRYLKGEKVAPKKFVEQVAAFMAAYGHSLSHESLENLHTLRKEAEEEGSPKVQNRSLREQNNYLNEEMRHLREENHHLKDEINHLHDEIARVKADTAEKEKIAWRSGNASMMKIFEEWKEYADKQVKDLDKQLLEASKELAQERQRVSELEAKVRDQEKLLGEANELVRELQAENELGELKEDLDRQAEELRQSREEIKVLRRKVEDLSDRKRVSEVATQAKDVDEPSQGAARDSKAKGKSAQRDGSRSTQDSKSGGDSLPAQKPSAQSDPASPDPTSTAAPQRSFMGSLFAAVSVLSALFVPVFLYLNFAAFAAACFSEDGPPWWGLVVMAAAAFFFTVAGLLLLIVLSYVTAGIAAPKGKEWSWGYPGVALFFGGLASVVSLISGIKLLVDGNVTERGLQWLHMFGISG
ncbi:hypothetical protein ACFYXC_40155 [Streptomyces sp. NPDC002701]|uniref:hypothetical protein n=1 Tax=Streptomyces sp. NPDC002701 TaxID=3364661 RepID=UPI00369ECAEC